MPVFGRQEIINGDDRHAWKNVILVFFSEDLVRLISLKPQNGTVNSSNINKTTYLSLHHQLIDDSSLVPRYRWIIHNMALRNVTIFILPRAPGNESSEG